MLSSGRCVMCCTVVGQNVCMDCLVDATWWKSSWWLKPLVECALKQKCHDTRGWLSESSFPTDSSCRLFSVRQKLVCSGFFQLTVNPKISWLVEINIYGFYFCEQVTFYFYLSNLWGPLWCCWKRDTENEMLLKWVKIDAEMTSQAVNSRSWNLQLTKLGCQW